ncbi:MAG: hypothetical protein AB1489_20670 [Acidobacteriota bacterium]
MSEDNLPSEVKKFIFEHLNSLQQLEILLLLYRSARKEGNVQGEWTADAVARELRSNPNSVAVSLAELQSRGILSVRGEVVLLYRYDPRTLDLDNAIVGLEQAYEQYRVTVLNLVFGKPLDKIRTFADAFKIRKEKE